LTGIKAPGGPPGSVEAMKVADIMVKDVVSTGPEAPVREVAALMLERRISGLPVVDGGGRVVGIVSEGDLIRRPEIGTDRAKAGWLHLFIGDEERAREFVKSHGRRVREIMTQPAISVAADAPLDEVVRLMEHHHVKRLPVLQGGKLAGLVTRADLLRALVARQAGPAVHVGDEELRKRIDAMLRKEDWAATAVVYVQVEKGVAQLWGTVDSEEQREALLLAVRGMPGVEGVQAHLGHALPG
jgi:CBS domain-containing protein